MNTDVEESQKDTTLAAPIGFAPFSWKLSSAAGHSLPPPIPLKNPRRFDAQLEHSETSYQSSSPAPSNLHLYFGTNASSAVSLEFPIQTSTPFPGAAVEVPDYSLPNSYGRDFRVQKDLGHGTFGQTALLQVVSANYGGIAHGFRLPPGTVFVAKKIETNPKKERTLYLDEWKILNILRGHRNILHAMCTQRPRMDHPYGHIFMEYCDMGDVWDMMTKYKKSYVNRMRQHGFHRYSVPKELRHLEAVPEGFACEMMTSVARGLAWMHYGIRDWPLESAIDLNWTSIMHNDLKPDNIFLVSRPAGDECPYPIFKIGDLGAATRAGSVAFVGNVWHSDPNRVTRCLGIPSIPAHDIYSLGSTMFEVAQLTFRYTEDFDRSLHVVYEHDANGESIPCPNGCPNIDKKHFKGRAYTPDEVRKWTGCLRFHGMNYSKETKLDYSPPFAKWWHRLVDDCMELDVRDRPHIIEVLERLYIGRCGRREDMIGSPLVLWNPWWLPDQARKSLQDRENGLNEIWEKASTQREMKSKSNFPRTIR